MITQEQIEAVNELQLIARDLDGVRQIQDIYGSMASSQYQIFTIVNRKALQTLKNEIDRLLQQGMKSNEDGKREFLIIVNNVNPNPIFYMDAKTKSLVIDQFKGVLPFLDDQLEAEFEAKKTELDV